MHSKHKNELRLIRRKTQSEILNYNLIIHKYVLPVMVLHKTKVLNMC